VEIHTESLIFTIFDVYLKSTKIIPGHSEKHEEKDYHIYIDSV